MRVIIVMVILELIVIMCIAFDVPYEPYGYVWLVTSIVAVVSVNMYEQNLGNRTIK